MFHSNNSDEDLEQILENIVNSAAQKLPGEIIFQHFSF